MSSEVEMAYQSVDDRERSETPKHNIVLTPWTVQNIIYEMVQDHLLTNDPEKAGFPFKDKYSMDDSKSGFLLSLAFNHKANVVEKKPAIFVYRDDAQFIRPTMNQLIGINVAESQRTKLIMTQMPAGIACIAGNVGFAEMLADYIRIPFMQFEEQIRQDFGFRRFKLTNVTKPQPYKEAKDNFIVILQLETVFDEGYEVRRDDLKIKTISTTIFDRCYPNVPLKLQ